MAFTELPEELIIDILSRLDLRSLLRCCATCRLLKELLDSTAELQYIAQLALDGLVDLGSGLSHTDLLEKLQTRREKWSKLQWETAPFISLDGDCWAYELVSGIFCKINRGEFTAANLIDGTITHVDDFGLPNVRDFAMDPTQDLIAFVQDDIGAVPPSHPRHVAVHIRSMSSHSRHPEASHPILRFSILPDPLHGNIMRSVVIQLADDALVMSVWIGGSTGDRLLGWNWRTGELLFDLTNETLPANSHDFCLISPRAFILTCLSSPGLLHLFTFTTNPPTLVASLHLPPLSPTSTARVRNLFIHSGPFAARPPPEQLFQSCPRKQILVVQVLYTDLSAPTRTYRLYVRNSTFLRLIDEHQRGKGARELLWEEWGPKYTRFFPAVNTEGYNWMRYVHGQRVVAPASSRDNIVHVLDFSPGLSRDIPSTRVPKGSLFEKDVCTHLPYRSSRRETEGEGYSGYMIDEERVIGLRSSPFMDTVELQVLSF